MNQKIKNWYSAHVGLSPTVMYTKNGEEWVLSKCPYHATHNRTMVVKNNADYQCFMCGATGNLFDMPKQKPEPADYGRLHAVLKAAKRYFVTCYQQSDEAKKYISKRKLTEETRKSFGIGYSDYGDRLEIFLKKLGFSRQELIQSGLFGEDEEFKMYFRFAGRLMFPITDIYGNIVAFGGRVLDNKKQPKYKNSPETTVFHKKETLFAYDRAKNTDKGFLIVCEGYMDVITMHQAGVTNSVASLGTAFTEGQALLIKDITDKVILLYDSDDAGQKATERAISVLEEAGIKCFVANTSPYKDADDYIKNEGIDAFRKKLGHPISAAKWKYLKAIKQNDMKSVVDMLISSV